MQNTSKLNQDIKSYQALVSSNNEAKEGFDVKGLGLGNARASSATTAPTTSVTTAPTTSVTTAPTTSVTTAPTSRRPSSIDAALEVSDIVKESHKYALVIFGILATYVLYKTLKNL